MSIFYIDTIKNYSISWNNLIEDLNNQTNVVKFCYQNDFYQIFKLVISSILNEQDITLIDGELTQSEVQNLITSDKYSEINQANNRRYNSISDKCDLVEKIRYIKEASITLFTSGTTGKPKYVKQSIENLRRGVVINEKMKSDIWGFAYHPTHIAGIQVFLQDLCNGNTIVRLFGLSADQIENVIDEHGITNISATPTFLRLLLSSSKRYKSVKRITSGGEKLDDVLLERMTNTFPNAKIRNIYATTEFGTLFKSINEGFQVKNEINDLVRIENNELKVHKSLLGEFESNLQEGVWYGTGDLVEMVSDNPLIIKFLGRKNEIVNVGGMKVNITEVEEMIRKLFDVIFVKVYSKSNSVVGNILCCEICFNKNTVKESEIRKKLSEFLQEYKIPRIIKIVDHIDQKDLTRTMKLNRK